MDPLFQALVFLTIDAYLSVEWLMMSLSNFLFLAFHQWVNFSVFLSNGSLELYADKSLQNLWLLKQNNEAIIYYYIAQYLFSFHIKIYNNGGHL